MSCLTGKSYRFLENQERSKVQQPSFLNLRIFFVDNYKTKLGSLRNTMQMRMFKIEN